MAKTVTDRFANIANTTLTMSGANTLTFQQIQMGVGLFEGKAMVIHRVHFRPTAAACREMVAATDAMYLAITTSNRLSSIIDVTDPSIIQQFHIVGVGVALEPWKLPITADYTGLPGGGKLVAANPLFAAMNTAGAAAASAVRVELEFSFIELSPAEYLEVIQSMFPANIA